MGEELRAQRRGSRTASTACRFSSWTTWWPLSPWMYSSLRRATLRWLRSIATGLLAGLLLCFYITCFQSDGGRQCHGHFCQPQQRQGLFVKEYQIKPMKTGMQSVGLCFLQPVLTRFVPLRNALLLSPIMAFIRWNCYANASIVSPVLWLSPYSRGRSVLPIVRTGISTASERRGLLAAIGVWSRLRHLWAQC